MARVEGSESGQNRRSPRRRSRSAPPTTDQAALRNAARFAEMPRAVRWTLIAGGMGAVAGLVVGLVVYPPTAAFAALELGIPSAILGGVAGAIVQSFTRTGRSKP